MCDRGAFFSGKNEPLYQKQLLTYLRLSRLRLGFQINFNVPYLKDGIKRIVILNVHMALMDFSFIQITDHHLLESEEQLREGFSPGHALAHGDEAYRGTRRRQGRFHHLHGRSGRAAHGYHLSVRDEVTGHTSTRLRAGPQKVNVEGLHDYPIYFLPGNHDDRELITRYLFSNSEPPSLYNFTFVHKGIQFIFMDWGAESKAFFFPRRASFLLTQLQSDLPSVIVCHQHVKPIGSRWLDDFIAEISISSGTSLQSRVSKKKCWAFCVVMSISPMKMNIEASRF